MAVYCYRCPECGLKDALPPAQFYESCTSCGAALVRDYRAEAVGIGSGVRVSRDGTVRDQADLFLPSKRDFVGRGDPDGAIGLKKWNESHDPAPGNTNPIRPRS